MSLKLDVIDLRIIRELQGDGRLSNVMLAKRVGLSPPACLRRVRSLEDGGVIMGYHADVDGGQLGFELTAFAMVGLHSQSESELTAFENLAHSWPIVRECYLMSGETDYMLKCIAPDMPTFQAFVTGELAGAPNVATVKMHVAIRRAKQEAGVPVSLLRQR